MKTNRPTFRSDEYADDSPDISAQKPFKGSDPYRHVAVAYSPRRGGDPHRSQSRKKPTEKIQRGAINTRPRDSCISKKVQVSAYRADPASTYNQCIYAEGC